jgi:hypothetical protein
MTNTFGNIIKLYEISKVNFIAENEVYVEDISPIVYENSDPIVVSIEKKTDKGVEFLQVKINLSSNICKLSDNQIKEKYAVKLYSEESAKTYGSLNFPVWVDKYKSQRNGSVITLLAVIDI